MGRIGLALRVFWRIVTGSLAADRVRAWLADSDMAAPAASGTTSASSSPPRPESASTATGTTSQPRTRTGSATGAERSDAITLLAALQREARFVDLVQESLGEYSDAQVGAAARDVLRDCREVLSRMFSLEPVLAGNENETVETPEPLAAGRFRISGNVSGRPPYRGRLIHHGWEATRCELPSWSGDRQSARVVAPAEIEC